MGNQPLMSLQKVRFCSPLEAGYTILVGASLDYPQLLSSSTSQRPSCTNLFRWVLCTFLWDLFWYCLYVQNSSRKYTSRKYFLRVLLGDVSWGLGRVSQGEETLDKFTWPCTYAACALHNQLAPPKHGWVNWNFSGFRHITCLAKFYPFYPPKFAENKAF